MNVVWSANIRFCLTCFGQEIIYKETVLEIVFQ